MTATTTTTPQAEGPIAIVSRELPTLGPRVEYVSAASVIVRLDTSAAGFQITLAALADGSYGRVWYVIKRSELISTPERACSTYNTAASWAERISAAYAERLVCSAPTEEIL